MKHVCSMHQVEDCFDCFGPIPQKTSNLRSLRNKIGSYLLEPDTRDGGDTLAIALCSYFESHVARPADDTESENGWSQWAEDKTNAALDGLARALIERTSQVETGADAADAAKWRALRHCARITAIGSAGMERPLDPDAHVTLNFWTHNERETEEHPRRWLDTFVKKALALKATAQLNTTSAAAKAVGVQEAGRSTSTYTADNVDSKGVAAVGHSYALGDPCPCCASGRIGQSGYNFRCANCGWLGPRLTENGRDDV